MYNIYKSKYLQSKKMLGGSSKIEKEKIFIENINIILSNSSNLDQKLLDLSTNIFLLIDSKNNINLLVDKIFNNDSLINIILNLLEPDEESFKKKIDLIEKIFLAIIQIIGVFYQKLIDIIINKINSDSIFKHNIISNDNLTIFYCFIKLINLLNEIYNRNIPITDDDNSNYNIFNNKISKTIGFSDYLNYYLNNKNFYNPIIKSLKIYNLSLDLNFDEIIEIRDFNVNIIQNKLQYIIEKIIYILTNNKDYPNKDDIYTFILNIYKNSECEKKLANPNSDILFTICQKSLGLIISQSINYIKNTILKPFDQITIDERSKIYEKYLGLLRLLELEERSKNIQNPEKSNDEKILKLFKNTEFDIDIDIDIEDATIPEKEANELIISKKAEKKAARKAARYAARQENERQILNDILSKIKKCRFYYFSDNGIFNYEFWEDILTNEELDRIKATVQTNLSSSVDINSLIKEMIPYYYSELSSDQNKVIYTIVLLVGLLNNKLSSFYNSKIVIKGGKALQFLQVQYFYLSNDTERSIR